MNTTTGLAALEALNFQEAKDLVLSTLERTPDLVNPYDPNFGGCVYNADLDDIQPGTAQHCGIGQIFADVGFEIDEDDNGGTGAAEVLRHENFEGDPIVPLLFKWVQGALDGWSGPDESGQLFYGEASIISHLRPWGVVADRLRRLSDSSILQKLKNHEEFSSHPYYPQGVDWSEYGL